MIETSMSAAGWAALLVTFGLAIIMPGPDTFLLLRLGVRSRRAAILAACGIMIGNLIWTTASVLGLAALMQTLPGALTVMQVAGSAVLAWMGVQSLLGGLRSIRSRRLSEQGTPAGQLADHALRAGLITNLSNPKALLFFAALFSQLVPSHASAFDRLSIVVALTVMGLAWFVAFALLTSAQGFQRWFGRATPFIDIAAGIVFLGVSGAVLFGIAMPFVSNVFAGLPG